MTEQDLMKSIKTYRNKLIDRIINIIGLVEEDQINIPWDDFTEYDKGFYEGLQKAMNEIEKLKIY